MRKISQEEAAKRISSPRGYELVSEYRQRDINAAIRCNKHQYIQQAAPCNIWRGGMLSCCAREANSERMKGATGEKNTFFGRKHSIESRERMSVAKLAGENHLRGKPRPEYLTAALKAAITGVPRSGPTKAKLSAHMSGRHRLFEFCRRKAECGRTAGKPGIFYVVRIGDQLKFGSATTTMAYRLTRLRQKHGHDVELKLHCIVGDAGAYEAAMMGRHREHWVCGEFFKDFLSQRI